MSRQIDRHEDDFGTERLFPVGDRLAVELCGVRFENPFILAASPCTDELSIVRRGLEMGWAGAVLKTTSVEGTRVDLAYPMMSSIEFEGRKVAGLGNIDLISAYHVDEICRRVGALKKEFPRKVIIGSLMGASRADWQGVTRRLVDAGADMIECSFSCPQGSMGEDAGKMLAQSTAATEAAAAWVKEAAGRTPVSIKITPQVTDIAEVARALRRAGVDCITASNSVPALMGVDIDTFSPIPSLGGKGTYSGFTGPAIKPITLRTIAEIAKAVPLPILGTGGVSTWRDAVEVMAVGAGVVQFCTAVMHYGFRIIDDLRSGMHHYLAGKGFASPAAIVGRALPNIVSHDELPRRKVRSAIDAARCVRCDLCVVACRDGGHEAIATDGERLPRVDEEKCLGCGMCMAACPVAGCISMAVRG